MGDSMTCECCDGAGERMNRAGAQVFQADGCEACFGTGGVQCALCGEFSATHTRAGQARCDGCERPTILPPPPEFRSETVTMPHRSTSTSTWRAILETAKETVRPPAHAGN